MDDLFEDSAWFLCNLYEHGLTSVISDSGERTLAKSFKSISPSCEHEQSNKLSAIQV